METKTDHKKGKVAPGKKNKNWRIQEDLVVKIQKEAVRLGFGPKGSATFLNNHFTRYFNGEAIKRDA